MDIKSFLFFLERLSYYEKIKKNKINNKKEQYHCKKIIQQKLQKKYFSILASVQKRNLSSCSDTVH